MKTALSLFAAVLVSAPAFAADEKQAAPKSAEAAAPAATAPAPVVKDVTPEEAERLLKSEKDLVVLDVRTPDEFQEGHIAGAQNIDFQGDDFATKVAALDKNKSYLVHCAAGGRSTRALGKLKGLDLKAVYHMNGGLNAWKKAGKPVEK